MKRFLLNIKKFALAHKAASAAIVIVLAGGGYYAVHAAKGGTAAPTYYLATARIGSVAATVTGTGQVSANNSQDVPAQVGGTVSSISVSVGQKVSAGDVLARIDSPSALQSLQSAQIAFAKLTEPAKSADVVNAQNSVSKAYSDTFSAVTAAFSDLPSIKAGLSADLYDLTGFISQVGPNENYIHTSVTAQSQWDLADRDYNQAVAAYASANADFQAAAAASGGPATTTIVAIAQKTSLAVTEFAQAVTDANSLAAFIAEQN